MTIITQLTHLLAPDYCCKCQKTGQIICQSCEEDIISEPFSQCLVCLKPTQPSQLCRHCKSRFNDAWVVGERAGTIEKLVDISKYESNRRGCQAQARLMDAMLPQLPSDVIVVPIPTIDRHIRQRGYGHMELVARELSRLRDYRAEVILGRIGSSVQHGADKATRQRQAKRAFNLRRHPPTTAPLLLIDDVYTTGATLRAATKLLRQHTEAPIYVAVTSRQLLD